MGVLWSFFSLCVMVFPRWPRVRADLDAVCPGPIHFALEVIMGEAPAQVTVFHFDLWHGLLRANFPDDWTARSKWASNRKVCQVWHAAGDRRYRLPGNGYLRAAGQQPLGIRMLGIFYYLFDAAALDNPTGVHYRNRIAELCRDAQVMRDKMTQCRVPVDPAHQVQNLRLDGDIHPWLVVCKHAGLQDRLWRSKRAAASRRKLCGYAAYRLLVRGSDLRHHLQHSFALSAAPCHVKGPGRRLRQASVQAKGFADLLPDGEDRFKRESGPEIHGDLLPRMARKSRCSSRAYPAFEQDFASATWLATDQPQDRKSTYSFRSRARPTEDLAFFQVSLMRSPPGRPPGRVNRVMFRI